MNFTSYAYENLTRSKQLQLLMIGVFVLITYIATLNGVMGYILNIRSITEASLLQTIAFAIPLFFVQAYLLVKSTHELLEWHNNFFLMKILYLIIFIFSFMFSAFFSYTFYYRLISAEAHSNKVLQEQVKKIKDDVFIYKTSFLSAKDAMNELAKYSLEKSIEENNKGFTCDPNVGKGNGPRKRYRESEKDIFSNQADKISKLYEKVNANEKSFSKYIDDFFSTKEMTIKNLEKKMNEDVNGFNKLGKLNFEVQNIADVLNDHYGLNRKIPKAQQSDLDLFCPDSVIDTSIKNIQIKLDSLPKIESVKLFDQSNTKALQERVFDVVVSLFSANNNKQDFTINDYFAFILGVIIECLIVATSFLYHNENGSHVRLNSKNQYKGKYFSTTKLVNIETALNVTPEQIKNIIKSAYQLNDGVIIPFPNKINSINDDNERNIILFLKRKTSKSVIYYNIPCEKALPRKKLLQDWNCAPDELVSLCVFPRIVWDDVILSAQFYQ